MPHIPTPATKDFPTWFHVTVDVVALTINDGILEVAVVERNSDRSCIDRGGGDTVDVVETPRRPGKDWALPGGHVYWDRESLTEAAQREIAEETGIEIDARHLEQLGAYGDLGRDPRPGRTVTVAFVAFRPMFDAPRAASDAVRARFMPVLELFGEGMRLEFDHRRILLDAISRVRDLLLTTSVATKFVPERFTLTQLREVYEVLWHPAYDPGATERSRRDAAQEIQRWSRSDAAELSRTVRSLAAMSRTFDSPSFEGLASLGSDSDEAIQASSLSATRLEFDRALRSMQRKANRSRPEVRTRLDPANFNRKVLNLGPRFCRPVEDDDGRPVTSRSSSSGRPAQLYEWGGARRLDPPLRLSVKRPPQDTPERRP